MPLPSSYLTPGSKYYQPPIAGKGTPTNGLMNQYNLFGSAVNKQQGDYDSIMEAYRKLLLTNGGNSSGNAFGNIDDYKPEAYTPRAYGTPTTFNPTLNTAPSKYTYKPPVAPTTFTPNQYGAPENYSPITNQYKQSSDLTDAISKLRNLSETGGYSEQGIADLRERGISPIRSIYSSANRDVDRAKALQGGSSNAYNALKSKMARELSDKIGGAVTNVNAGIAQNVAQNKLQASPILASVTGQQSNLQNEMGRENTSILNSANYHNVDNRNAVNTANTDMINKGNLFNIGRGDEYNKQLFDEKKFADLFNIGRTDDVNKSNTALSNDAQLRNIGALDDTNRANTDLFNKFNDATVNERNKARQINMELPIKRSQLASIQGDDQLKILDSMKSLFGTTPALANLFGSQALSGSSLQNTINQGNNNNAMEMIMRLMQSLGGGR